VASEERPTIDPFAAVGKRKSNDQFLMMLKVLNRTLVGFGGFSCAERAEVAPTPGLGIFFARVQPVLAGFQFSNHRTIHSLSVYRP